MDEHRLEQLYHRIEKKNAVHFNMFYYYGLFNNQNVYIKRIFLALDSFAFYFMI
jgi:hypothetical protein